MRLLPAIYPFPSSAICRCEIGLPLLYVAHAGEGEGLVMAEKVEANKTKLYKFARVKTELKFSGALSGVHLIRWVARNLMVRGGDRHHG